VSRNTSRITRRRAGRRRKPALDGYATDGPNWTLLVGIAIFAGVRGGGGHASLHASIVITPGVLLA
jgi:hypothetical protein